ncbi:MAG: WD40-repeat-containing domain protein [Linnemannia gamsii]|nr:MAG: WD40-repeat-containing domain protein [Linnemannia gamsii]
MDNPSSSQANLIPFSLLSTSLFQRKRKSLTNSPAGPSSSVSSPVIRGHPIVVPQVPFTDIIPPEDLLVKEENVDDQRLPFALPSYQRTTTINDSDSDTERNTTQMPVHNNHSKDTRDRHHYRESTMIPDGRPPKETPRFNNRVGMSVPPLESSYISQRRDDRHPYPNNSHSNNIYRDNRLERNDFDRRTDNRGPDPFLQEQSRVGRHHYDVPPPPLAPQRRYDNTYDASESSGPPERGRFFEGVSNKRRNESASPKPRKRTGSMTEDVMSGIADVSLVRNRSPELRPYTGPSKARSSQSQSSSDDSEYDRVRQRTAATSANPRSKSVFSTAATAGVNGMDVDMSPRKPEFRSSESKHKNKRRRTARETSGESSSSNSSSSESDSSSDESDAPRLTGASGLKLHGQIHDLMLELERTRTKYSKYAEKAKAASKRIRNISKKLERRFRDLSERPAISSHETTASERPMMASRPSSDKVMQNTSTSSLSSKTSAAAPKSISSKGRSGPSRIRLAQYNDRVAVASLDVVETLTNVHADIRNKTFGRKPRCMLHHVPIAGPEMEEVMVTSALDGTIQFWDLERRRVTSTIQKGPTNMPWAEDMCWVGKNTLAVASAHKEGVPMTHQLMLVHVEKAKPNSSVQWTTQSLDQKPHDNSKGGILCLSALTEDRSGISMASAGMDKQIIRWKFTPPNSDGDCVPSQQVLIHNKHTSTIQGLCYTPHNNILFSGGSDCKIIGWNMERSEVVYDYKSKERGRINSLTPNPVDPNLLLVCHATTNNQLSLHDLRVRFDDPVLRFGFECADNLSRQVMPSWHPGGAIVSSGTQSDPKINIWDIRWRDVHRGAGQSIDGQSKRVFKAAFHPTKPFITSMSADSSLAFIDFRLNPGTVVHR